MLASVERGRVVSHVRPLTIEELPRAEALGQEFHRLSGDTGTFHVELFLQSWNRVYATGRGTIIGLWLEDDLVGGLGGLLAPDMETGVVRAYETFWYVTPRARGLGGWGMLEQFESWAKARGATVSRIGHLAGPDNDRFSKVYGRKGYRLQRLTFEKEL